KNAYPVPPMSHLLTLFHGATFFLKLDLRGAYNLIQIAKGQEWLTAMRTWFGSFEYTVMPFGLFNAPLTFQHFVNDIFANLVEVYVMVYLNDILFYSKTLDNHVQHVGEVLNSSKEFEALNKAFTTAPILAHFSEISRTLIETDASDYAVAGFISQYSSLNLLHPVAFESRNLSEPFE
ncbi:hypothetical protein VP01_7821g1, partial [Puccinia sorghi]